MDKNDNIPLLSEIQLRDYFAAQALVGIVSRMGMTEDIHNRDTVARYCYGYANAMMEARKQ